MAELASKLSCSTVVPVVEDSVPVRELVSVANTSLCEVDRGKNSDGTSEESADVDDGTSTVANEFEVEEGVCGSSCDVSPC